MLNIVCNVFLWLFGLAPSNLGLQELNNQLRYGQMIHKYTNAPHPLPPGEPRPAELQAGMVKCGNSCWNKFPVMIL